MPSIGRIQQPIPDPKEEITSEEIEAEVESAPKRRGRKPKAVTTEDE